MHACICTRWGPDKAQVTAGDVTFVAWEPDFEAFVLTVAAAFEKHWLQERAIWHVMSDRSSLAYPPCTGTWMEFGVAGGPRRAVAMALVHACCHALLFIEVCSPRPIWCPSVTEHILHVHNGPAGGQTINETAKYKHAACGSHSPPVYG